MRSNCLFFALALYRRRRRKGKDAYLVVRRSRWGKFPHVLYAERRPCGVRLVSYSPKDPRHKACPPPLFAGRTRWGDK